jgi:fatty acid desaturase
MVMPEHLRPLVLPTAHLLESGKATAELRRELRRIPNWRNTLSVVMVYGWTALIAVLAAEISTWWSWLIAFILMGPMHARFAILMHEAAHNLLFSRRSANDLVGTWLIAAPALVPMSLYRRSHFAHHREEFGPGEPDLAFYEGYPTTRAALRRRLLRDAVGISGWKNLTPLLRALRTRAGRTIALPLLGAQAVLFAAFFALTGWPFAYLVLWLLPWLTHWRVLNRLRAIAEHGGLEASSDRRATTHDVRQHLLARFWFVPYNTGWHLAHHVDMGIPFRNLPRYYDELRAANYVSDGLTYSSYLSLWRALTSADHEPTKTTSTKA